MSEQSLRELLIYLQREILHSFTSSQSGWLMEPLRYELRHLRVRRDHIFYYLQSAVFTEQRRRGSQKGMDTRIWGGTARSRMSGSWEAETDRWISSSTFLASAWPRAVSRVLKNEVVDTGSRNELPLKNVCAQLSHSGGPHSRQQRSGSSSGWIRGRRFQLKGDRGHLQDNLKHLCLNCSPNNSDLDKWWKTWEPNWNTPTQTRCKTRDGPIRY